MYCREIKNGSLYLNWQRKSKANILTFRFKSINMYSSLILNSWLKLNFFFLIFTAYSNQESDVRSRLANLPQT
jgi:hypothetical protein